MTYQDIIRSLDELSLEEQTSLLNMLRLRLQLVTIAEQTQEQSLQDDGERFWQGVLKFRTTLEQEDIQFTETDFANLRDSSPGREVEL